MRRVFAAVLTMTLAQAATPARADDAARLRIAREIVATTHTAEKVRQMMPTFMQQMRPLLERSGGDPKAVDAFMGGMEKRFDAQVDGFVDLAAQVYAREFSDDDLQALLTFYRTPAGQHLLDKQVLITQGMAAVGGRWGEMVAKQVLEDFAKQKAQAPKL